MAHPEQPHLASQPEELQEEISTRWPVAIAAIMMVIAVATKHSRTKHLLHIVSQPLWLANMAVVLLFCLYVYEVAPAGRTTRALRDAASKGVVAMIIG